MWRLEASPIASLLLWGASMALLTACQRGMENQPKSLPFQESDFFQDGRADRLPVPGTVARGEARGDALFYTGKQDGKDAGVFPYPVTRTVLERGRERYDVFCAVCHGRTGDGDGMIVRRGFPRPPSYHEARLRAAPAGHFFDVVTNGFGRMFPYGDRVPPRDRWAIAAYIRALQESRDVPVSQLTAEQRAALEKDDAPSAEDERP